MKILKNGFYILFVAAIHLAIGYGGLYVGSMVSDYYGPLYGMTVTILFLSFFFGILYSFDF